MSVEIRDRVVGLERVRARDLVPNARNWRRHGRLQRQAMSSALSEIGYAGALLARRGEDGRLILIDGHLRAETTPDAEVPVLVLDVTEAEALKILAFYDPISAMADVDETALRTLVQEVQFDTSSLADAILSAYEIKPLRADEDGDSPARIDEAEQLREKWGVERGQLWRLGAHRLMCGDSTSAEDVARLMDGERAALMNTDPPYGVDYANVLGGRERQKEGGWSDISGDNLGDTELEELLVAAFQLCEARTAFVWHSWKRVEVFLRALRRCSFVPSSEIVWVKNALVFGRSDYQWRHESCIYAKRDGAGRQDDRTATTVWEFPKTTGAMHPTQKPIGLFVIPIENHTQPGDVCYEPFSGSGSQIIAAERTGRRCFAMELAPKYVAVALQRWVDATAGTPVLLEPAP